MSRMRLQTQLLISTLLIICALTGAILLIIRPDGPVRNCRSSQRSHCRIGP